MKRSGKISIFLLLGLFAGGTLCASRIKDLTSVEGGRDNQLVGYGLVAGLAGDGDSRLNYTIQSIANSLKRFGITVPADKVKSDNMAAVIVTADIGPFMRSGSRIDVTVSSIGDAASLQGGVLLQTPLIGADGKVYAVAQGPVAVGGFIGGSGGAGGATVQKNHPTVGIISGGAIVERRIETSIVRDDGSMDLLLLNPDFTTSVRIADAINSVFPASTQAGDSACVNVRVPEVFRGQAPNFLAIIGSLEVQPDSIARIIINERTGTIVATQPVRLSSVAVSHGALVITISSSVGVSQPQPMSRTGQTAMVPSTSTDVDEKHGAFAVIEEYPTLERLTQALNALGVSTREMISILQTMKRAGALQAELVIN
ncbi:MAG: flagellar basal body P-ring protein FlgI [Opitutales bacterium]|jgi:flagellar P-ring protein precursor FlgI